MKEKSSIPINQEEISHYLKDIRKIKVMTPERERVLAEKMLSGKISLKENFPAFSFNCFLISSNLKALPF